MNKLTIPAILVATVMVAGIFAFMPIEQASTVHTTISRIATLTEDKTVDGADFTITCPAASNGCRILDVYLVEREAGANDADINTITLTVDGADDIVLAVDGDNTVVNDGAAEVNNISGVTMPSNSVIVIDMDLDASVDFGLIVIVESDGAAATLS